MFPVGSSRQKGEEFLFRWVVGKEQAVWHPTVYKKNSTKFCDVMLHYNNALAIWKMATDRLRTM